MFVVKFSALACIFIFNSKSFVSSDFLPVEGLRAEVLQMTSYFWDAIKNLPKGSVVPETRSQMIKTIIKNYHRFVIRENSILKHNFVKGLFPILETYSSWRTKEDQGLKASDAFNQFRDFLERVHDAEVVGMRDELISIKGIIKELDTLDKLVMLNGEEIFFDEIRRVS